MIDEVTPLSKLSVGQKLFLRLNMADEQLMDTLMALFQRFPGNVPVVLYDYLTEKKQLVPKNLYVNLSSGFLNGANELLLDRYSVLSLFQRKPWLWLSLKTSCH